MLLLLTFSVSVSAQDERAETQLLREQIASHEESSAYADMILAAAQLRDSARSVEDRVFALRSLGRAYALLSDHDRALEAMNAAVELVEADMAATSFAEIYRDTAGLLGELGRFEQALALIDRGLVAIDSEPESELRGSLLVMKGRCSARWDVSTRRSPRFKWPWPCPCLPNDSGLCARTIWA